MPLDVGVADLDELSISASCTPLSRDVAPHVPAFTDPHNAASTAVVQSQFRQHSIEDGSAMIAIHCSSNPGVLQHQTGSSDATMRLFRATCGTSL